MKITQFYNDEYSASANYQSFRSIGNYIDSLKNGSRKIINTVNKNNISSDIKVSILASKVAEENEYLHGEASLCGTIVNLAQNFVGSNNLNLLQPEGNFGTRFIPESSASRYIYTKKSKIFDRVFLKEDSNVLISQSFEGKEIEPKFFVPIIPLILINGSEGIGNGFAQKILPRDKNKILDVLMNYLSGKKISSIPPSISGYKGPISVSKEDPSKIIIEGVIDIKNSNTLLISEIPFTYNLQSYLKVLKQLEEDKIIKGYIDRSDNDIYEFEIDCTREFVKTPNDELINIFKLSKSVTENFTCINENNAIVEFKNEIELIKDYVKVRLDFYDRRKNFLLKKYESDNSVLENKIKFIMSVVDGTIVVSNKSKIEIEKQLTKLKIKKVDGDYDYLLRMSIHSLTKEKIIDLNNELEESIKKYEDLKEKTNKELWKKDLEDLKNYI